MRESGLTAIVVKYFPIAQAVTLEVNVSITENARIQMETGIYIMENVEERKSTTQKIVPTQTSLLSRT